MSAPRILVVEDEALVAEDLCDNLRDVGFEPIDVVSSGEAAIETARQLTPDLVLMDIRLKGALDGIAAAGAIKETPGCPVVFLTAYAEDTTIQRATAAEPYGYLVKPVNMRELQATVQMALYKARMEKEREELRRQLEQALEEVKTLRHFLPICAWCRKVRDDDGYWQKLETYVSKRLNARISHGICPSCAEKEEML